ncbi:MAG TPA: hypothetical protein VLZ84_04145, partial [Asticcacaulis sp.]|nr:hypothetical protein [Asticcacaulis sp.]
IVGISGNVVTIVPNVWEDIPAATPLNFDAPGCQVHCLNVSEALSSINLGRFASLTLQFEEDFPEPA